MCTNHYIECWYEQNEQYHDIEKQRKYVIEWTNAIEKMILNSNKSHAIRCLKNQEINVQEISTTHLQ